MAPSLSRTGQINGSGNEDALLLKQWSGEVLKAFKIKTVTRDKHMVRGVGTMKSAQFPAFGQATASYHTPGTELTGQAINQAEVEIFLDYPLIADVFVAEWDQVLTHFDYKSIYTDELSESLAREFDKVALRLLCKGATMSANVSGGNTGDEVQIGSGGGSRADLTADNLLTGLATAALNLNKNEVPANGRYAIFRPDEYQTLVQGSTAQNRDYGGVGSIREGALPRVFGIDLDWSNQVPTTNISSPSGAKNDYSYDASNTVAPVFHRSALGTIQRMAVTMEAGWERRFQTNHVLAKQMHGHGILRPEACQELVLTP